MPNNNRYNESLNWLDNLNQNEIKPGLERIKEMMRILGNPQKKLRIITIGGTNAKGSTSYNLSKTLMQTGKKIGCFTSPHLHTVRERIRINNRNIDKETFSNELMKLKELSKQNNLRMTYFEILTAMAYLYFRNENVDYAVMEIGLGGEWDAVNVADAEIAILTTLGLDHTEYLGDSLDKIAMTKAKIVRKNTTVITGWEQEYHKYIPNSKEMHYASSISDWIEICLKCLSLSIEPIISQVPGRQEVHLNFTLDTAHNQQAIQYLLSLGKSYNTIIIGMLKDKKIESFVNEIPRDCMILACGLGSERSASSKQIYDICTKLGIKCRQFENVKDAISYVKNENTLITGSFYTVSEARKHFKLEGSSEL